MTRPFRPLAARRLAAAALAALAMTLTSCSDNGSGFDRESQIGANPVLPKPAAYLVTPINLAKPAPFAKGETPSVAAGLKIEAIASDLAHPRRPYVLPNGDILVVESGSPGTEPPLRPKDFAMGLAFKYVKSGNKPGNRITILRDTDGDGSPDARGVLLDNLNSPFGVALVGGDLYVANTDAVMRYPYTAGQAKITAPGVKLTDLPAGINHHWTKDMVASPDGSKLYVGVGSNSNILENGAGSTERERAAILEVDRATGAYRVFAGGLRNPNGLTFYPGSNTLWAVINERDEIGPNLVPDYLTSVKDGAFYGWPYSYYGAHIDPRVPPQYQRPDLVAKAIAPDYALSSHVAPLGLAFDTAGALGAQYRGGAFIGEHGSWNRGQLNGYRVVFVPFANGRPSGKAITVVNGFIGKDGKARGRPVGLAFDAAGALLIADDGSDTLWRVTAGQ